MRVLQVSDFYPPDPGGLEAHVARLSAALVARGHDVEVAAVGSATEVLDGPVAVHRFGLSLNRLPVYAKGRAFHPPWPDPAFSRSLLDLARRYRPDIIHAHGWSEFSAAAVGRQLDLPVVVTLHDYGLRCPTKSLHCGGCPCRTTFGLCCLACAQCDQGVLRRSGLATAIRLGRRRLTTRVARFLAVSSYVAQTHLDVGIGNQRTMHVVPNFVDDSANDPAPAQIGGPVLFVGPSAPHKGRYLLERAYQTLPTVSRPRLLLVGDAVPTPGTASVPGVDHLGRRSGAELSAAFGTASVVVVPSVWHDPCPTVALEAMAAGRPVIASAVGGLTDIIEPDVTGLLIPPTDVRALTEALHTLIDDPQLAAKLGAAGKDRVANRFSASAVVPQVERLYQEVVS